MSWNNGIGILPALNLTDVALGSVIDTTIALVPRRSLNAEMAARLNALVLEIPAPVVYPPTTAFAGELVRSRTFRRRYTPERGTPAGVLASVNAILHERGLEEYYCTLCYAYFDLKRRVVTIANSGLPYPVRSHGGTCAQIHLPGMPLGSFAGATYDEITLELAVGDVFVFCTDGIYEAFSPAGDEFGAARVCDIVTANRHLPARAITDAIFRDVEAFRGERAQSDDMTAVAVKITS
jgi:sigma-B regulation protein RsbU (phosphoserine phosphatase)